MTIRGLLRQVFLGGRAWVLDAEDGVTWQIIGDVPASLVGEQVEVEGKPAEQQFGITMVGPIFEADSIEAL